MRDVKHSECVICWPGRDGGSRRREAGVPKVPQSVPKLFDRLDRLWVGAGVASSFTLWRRDKMSVT